MNRLMSITTMPICILAGCGDKPKTEDDAATHSVQNRVVMNGLRMPDGRYRAYLCNAMLKSPLNDKLRTLIGERRFFQIKLLRSEQHGASRWWAIGRFDNYIVEGPQHPFPASERVERDHIILNWETRPGRVSARLEWTSAAEKGAVAEFDVSNPNDRIWANAYPYRMRGECAEQAQDPATAMLNGDKS